MTRCSRLLLFLILSVLFSLPIRCFRAILLLLCCSARCAGKVFRFLIKPTGMLSNGLSPFSFRIMNQKALILSARGPAGLRTAFLPQNPSASRSFAIPVIRSPRARLLLCSVSCAMQPVWIHLRLRFSVFIPIQEITANSAAILLLLSCGILAHRILSAVRIIRALPVRTRYGSCPCLPP